MEIPVQIPMFRILPSALRNGKEINTVAVLFTQGVNEQQSIADTLVNYLSTYLSVYLLCIYLSTYVCMYLSIYLPTYLPMYLSIYHHSFGDSHLQDQINLKSLQRLTSYCEKFRERFGTSGIPLSRKAKEVADLLQQLRSQIHTRKAKNTDILTLSQAVSYSISIHLFM